jgi:integral membrane sensor domain MASE1
MFAALYFVAMIACIMVGRFGAQVTPIWIPSAILAWALLTTSHKFWPIIVAFVGIAHMLGAFVVGDQFQVELVYLIGNIASPLLLVWLLRRRGDELEFEDRGEVIRFLLYGGALAPALSTAIASLPALLSDTFTPHFAAIWFFADGLSFVVFLPLFKIVATNGWKSLLAPDIRARAFGLLGVLLVAHLISAFLPASSYRIFMLLLIPYLIYVAFDAGMTAARAALAISAILLLSVAVFIPAPADRNLDPQGYLLALQVFVATTVASVLPIAAALEERRRLYDAASEAVQDAHEAWGELVSAEAHYRLIADHSSELILHLRDTGEIVFASPSCDLLNGNASVLKSANFIDFVDEQDRSRLRNEIAALKANASFDQPREWQLRLREMNDTWRLYHVRATLISDDEFVAVLRQVQE